jgi:hypothetical protein
VAVTPVDPPVGGTRHGVSPRHVAPPRPLSLDRRHAMGDAADGALAIAAVAGALVRYAVDTAARNSHVLPRLASLGPVPVARRVLGGTVARALAHPATAAVRALAAVADELVPEVTRAVLARLDVPGLVREFVDVDRLAAMLDVEAVVARVDLDAVIARVDLDAVIGRVDIARVLDRVDLDAVVARVDLDAAIARVDLDAVIDKVDVTRVIDRVDLDAVVARVDLDAAIARVDLDAVIDKVDVTRVIDRVDLDAVVARVDLDGAVDRVDLDRAVDRVDVDRVISRTDLAGLARYVVQEIDLPGLLRASTGTVTNEMVRSVRDQGVDADRAVERIVDRLLRRQGRRTGTIEGGSDHDQR